MASRVVESVAALPLKATSAWSALYPQVRPAISDLINSEVYVLASAVAFNALLSLIPFSVLLLFVCLKVLHWPRGYEAILQLLREQYLPVAQDFIVENLRRVFSKSYTDAAALSVGALIITSSGIFGPVEMALNRAWKVEVSRPWWRSQLMGIGLVLLCGLLALGSVYLAAESRAGLDALLGDLSEGSLSKVVIIALVKVLIFPITAAIFFVIYYLLPNHKIAVGQVLPAATLTALVWEVTRYLFILSLPLLRFQIVYGAFFVTVTLVTWAFLSALILLFGANLAARSIHVHNRRNRRSTGS